jgi:hypothetical protein
MQKQYRGVTVNDLYNAMYRQVNALVDVILTYESDTFSSDASRLTPQEAESVAFLIISNRLQAMIDLDTLDGGMIADALDEVRGNI